MKGVLTGLAAGVGAGLAAQLTFNRTSVELRSLARSQTGDSLNITGLI